MENRQNVKTRDYNKVKAKWAFSLSIVAFGWAFVIFLISGFGLFIAYAVSGMWMGSRYEVTEFIATVHETSEDVQHVYYQSFTVTINEYDFSIFVSGWGFFEENEELMEHLRALVAGDEIIFRVRDFGLWEHEDPNYKILALQINGEDVMTYIDRWAYRDERVREMIRSATIIIGLFLVAGTVLMIVYKRANKKDKE